jgi:hypothetical protein
MLDERILKKNDTQQRGKISVFYAITEYAKKLKLLRLLRTDPKHDLFKKIYTFLVFFSIYHPSCICTANFSINNLDKLLSDINATRNDLVREFVKRREKEAFENVTTDPDVKPLPHSVIIEYKPISQVRISEIINYAVNYKNNKYIISTSYQYVLPGFSPEDFSYYAFKPKSEDLQEAFVLLLKFGLIRPLMTFRGMTRYVWTDERLNDLVQNLRLIYELECNLFCFRCYFHDEPTYEEKQRWKFFNGGLTSRIHLNTTELARFDLKKRVREQKAKRTDENLWKEKEDIDKEIERQKQKRDYIIELLKKEYSETIKKSIFLHEIISLAYPRMLQ